MRASRFILSAGLLLAATTAYVPAYAQVAGSATMAAEHAVIVGDAPMYPSRNIIQNAVNSKDHTTLVAAVKAAGLVQTLEGAGPFTVFAPTNEAFNKLPPGTVANLLKPENKQMLTTVLTYHVVAGRYTEADLIHMVKSGGGTAMLKTVQGEPLTITWANGRLWVKGEGGGLASITVPDVTQSNGEIQVVNAVLMPK